MLVQFIIILDVEVAVDISRTSFLYFLVNRALYSTFGSFVVWYRVLQ